MNLWQIFIPLITAFSGWFAISITFKLFFRPYTPRKIAGITFQGIYPQKHKDISDQAASFIAHELSLSGMSEQKLINPSALKQLMPFIDEEVDKFLKIKLTQTMPYITAFIGEKTISQLKAVFMEELEILFPELIKRYVAQLKEGHDVEKLIAEKLNEITAEKLEKVINTNISKELKRVKITGAITGFIIGIIYLLLTLTA